MALLSRSKSAKSLFHISRKSTKQHTPLFDIRLDTPDKDVLVLKGTSEEAPPVMLSGVVVLSVTEPIAVKKLNLQLYATITMHWEDKYRSSNGSIFKKPYSHTAVIFNYQWDSLNLQEFLEQKTREILAGEGAGWTQGGEAMSPNGSMGGSIVGSVRGSVVGLSAASRAASPGTQEFSPGPAAAPPGAAPGTTPGTQVAPPGTLNYRVPSSSSLVGFTTGHQAGSHSSSYSSLSSLPSVHAAEATASSLEANSVGSGSTEASGDMPNNGSAGNPLARSFSTSNIRRNKSATTLAGLSSTVSTKLESTVLAPGNYEFPFRTVLQGSIPESIDGLKGCSLVYRMQSVLERNRFSRPILTQRIVHVVRTLRADASELTETVAVDNTWPGKVDYSISVPTRAIAVGSVCNVEIILVPLAKGLRLGTVKIKLAEYSSLVTSASSHTQEKHVLTKKILPALADSPDRDVWDPESYVADPEGVFYRSQYLTLSEDRWLVQVPLQIPASLAHITQDCDIKGSVKVRHKLKFSIGLVNPDGHVSELRATLPISIFVSPFVPVSARGLDGFVAPFSLSNYEDATLKVPGSDTLFEATIAPPSINSLSSSSTAHNSFIAGSPLSHINISTTYSSPQLHRGASGASVITAADAQPNSQLSTQQLMAPPSYEHHIFDQLCQAADNAVCYDPPALMNKVGEATSGVSKEGGKVGNATSNEITKGTSATSATNPPSTNPQPTLSSFPQPSIISGPSFQNGHAHYRNGTSFSTANLSAVASPQSITPVQYLSRVGSFINEPRSPGTEKWNTKALSRVPSYETAIKTDAASEYLTPAYEPPNLESQINLDLLDSRLESVNESADSSQAPERPPLHTYASEISAHTARRSHGLAKFTLQGNEDPADHQSVFSHSTYQTAASSSAMPSLSRTRSSGSMLAAAHALKPSYGSTTSLLSKQFHMLHRINSNTSIGSKEDGSSTAGSLRGKRSKSTLNFHLFHH